MILIFPPLTSYIIPIFRYIILNRDNNSDKFLYVISQNSSLLQVYQNLEWHGDVQEIPTAV